MAIKVTWEIGYTSSRSKLRYGTKVIPSTADIKSADDTIVFLSEDHKTIYIVVPNHRLISAVEEDDINA